MRHLGPSMLISLPRLRLCRVSQIRYRRPYIAQSLRCHQFFGSARFASSYTQDVYKVPVGGNGYVSLSVVQPKPANVASANVIIRLPQGPLFQSLSRIETGNDPSVTALNNESEDVPSHHMANDIVAARVLADVTSSTVVTIDYRLGEIPYDEGQVPLQLRVGSNTQPKSLYYRYPTPVHDTLAGFDWVMQNLQPKRIGLFGTHIGGSLALMLALTEPRLVHTMAALDPVCDWTSLDEYCTASRDIPRRRQVPKDLVPLLEARERLFATQERYFDSFASPMLFLRSPGKYVPKVFPKYLTDPEHPIPVRVSNEHDEEPGDLWDAYIPDDRLYDEQGALNVQHPNPDDNHLVRRRKALSRWPPYGLDYGSSGPPGRYSREPIERLEVSLPWIRLFTHQPSKQSTNESTVSAPESESADHPEHKHLKRRRNQNHTVLSNQAADMVDVMRRACFWGRESGFGKDRVTLSSISVPEESEKSNIGLRPDSNEILSHAGKWLAETLGSNSDSTS
ncbi:uncharacterized protein APUU_60425S [Aspergillus puulaauensis]|uniref:Alpha/beta hydrolase fold-3 domain-containing protein n=1 Tax=Aspergillus puulaauensis TaxID=1220207 RepID=A0A7R7XU18_9EURO|nr:uncharacterized protein APUU_60425S [Aspergillus puulaauensis]BCS27377.1 hypothetical protein APUU_60425S [Aspergillus puulaauensis]